MGCFAGSCSFSGLPILEKENCHIVYLTKDQYRVRGNELVDNYIGIYELKQGLNEWECHLKEQDPENPRSLAYIRKMAETKNEALKAYYDHLAEETSPFNFLYGKYNDYGWIEETSELEDRFQNYLTIHPTFWKQAQQEWSHIQPSKYLTKEESEFLNVLYYAYVLRLSLRWHFEITGQQHPDKDEYSKRIRYAQLLLIESERAFKEYVERMGE